jgi:hypothetical protein
MSLQLAFAIASCSAPIRGSTSRADYGGRCRDCRDWLVQLPPEQVRLIARGSAERLYDGKIEYWASEREIEAGMRWTSHAEAPPPEWSPVRQLRAARLLD